MNAGAFAESDLYNCILLRPGADGERGGVEGEGEGEGVRRRNARRRLRLRGIGSGSSRGASRVAAE